MLIAALCADGESEIGNVAPDRPRLRAHRRAPARARRAHRAPGRVASRGRDDDPPDPQRDARRPARRDARAARDHRARCAACSSAPATARSHTPALEYEAGADARRPGGRRARLQAVRRAGQRARAALGHDDPDRARGRDPLRGAPSRRCASATSRTPTAPCARSAARTARCCRPGSSWSACPAPEGTAEALTRAVRGARRGRAWRATAIGLGDASLYPALLDAHGVPAAARARDPARARHARLRRPGARGRGPAARARGDRGAARACRSCAAGRRCSTRAGAGRRRACARVLRRGCRAGVAERVIFDLGLARSLGYYTGAVFEVYDAALGAPLGGGGRYDDLLGRFGRDLPGGGLGAERRAAAHRAGRRAPRGAAVSGLNGLTLAVPRGALFARDARPARPRSASTPPRCAPTTASCCSRTPGIVTMRPSDVPTYVEAGAADLGITGKDVLAEQSERAVYELLDLGFGPCVMVVRHRRRARTGRGGAAAPRRDAGRDEVPADRRAPLRAHRPPGRDRRGQGLGRAGAADRAWSRGSSTSPRPARRCARTGSWCARRSSPRPRA